MIRRSGFQASSGMRRRSRWWEARGGKEPELYIVTKQRETHQVVDTHEISSSS
jgi:hypothetical protein